MEYLETVLTYVSRGTDKVDDGLKVATNFQLDYSTNCKAIW